MSEDTLSAAQRECDEVCTSSCHASDCEHHGHIALAAERDTSVSVEAPKSEHVTCFAAPETCPDPPAHCGCGNVGKHVPNVDCDPPERDTSVSVGRVLWPAGANWTVGKREVIVELLPVGEDGRCTGCGGEPSRETGSCKCVPRLAALRATTEAPAEAPEPGLDARRYQRLRILGAAPGYSPQLEAGNVLCFTNLDDYVDRDLALHPSRGEFRATTPTSTPEPDRE